MRGSDMVIYETANPNTLLDAHVRDKLQPIPDECQDWTYVNAVSKNGFLIFEGKRKLVTNDTQDHEILEDDDVFMPAQKVIIAWATHPRTYIMAPRTQPEEPCVGIVMETS
jgi:hypothetical protein